jgi:hypothetical protein
MRAKRLSLPVAVAALALAAAPSAPAVTIGDKLLAALHAHATAGEVVSRKSKLHSCQAGDDRNRVRLPGPELTRETERKAATVACEQPPKGGLDLNGGLKGAEASALIAAG